MSILYRILGQPGRDNALFVEIDTGQAVHRLLFDCGEACLRDVPISKIQAVDAVFFSHFHIDHVAGFDTFLRHNYCREEQPVEIYGPLGVQEIIRHRLQGVTWNLVDDLSGEFLVHEIASTHVSTSQILTCEGFAVVHAGQERPLDGLVVDAADYTVEVRLMDHDVPSAAYLVREKPRHNIDTDKLANLGLVPGPWLKTVKAPDADTSLTLEFAGRRYSIGELQEQLLVRSLGDSIAYLTDFRLDPTSEDRLVEMLDGCQTIVCENNFRNADRELAMRSYHMVSGDVARLASRVGSERLILFHLSDRYSEQEWRDQLAEVRAVFPATDFPDSWKLTEGEYRLVREDERRED